ncbi:homeotic protein caudal-like [Chelonus insularis]|uniref:homeotic protein caudal-like n=1 Tax=Chelonus insularis TaxID=460826 RepID=UPI001589A2DB|nr:homeotic protein caudal-like [Chelonus insularis]
MQMTDISRIGMVSYYNPLTMYRQQTQAGTTQQQLAQQAQHQVQIQQHPVTPSGASESAGQQYWYGYPHAHPHGSQHQVSATQQYLEPSDVLSWSPHSHHYSHHLQYQHQVAYQQQHQSSPMTSVSEWNGDKINSQAVGSGEPSPPITVSGSEISSPGTPLSPSISNNNNINAPNNNTSNNVNSNNTSGNSTSTTPVRPAPIRSPYEWIKKSSYQNQHNPGKTRTKDKYRVVYTDHQRLELEKEFHYSRYITIRRKAELAANLSLSERQVKIWFQNRRAKERKQVKKREELEQKDVKPTLTSEGLVAGGMANLSLGGMSGMLGGYMHNGSPPPLSLGPPPHGIALSHPTPTLHSHQHVHPHTVHG